MGQPPALISLSARNFRSLRKVDLDLGPINVLVGPNAAGKSNVLDVLAFLGDASGSDLQPALERRGGFERVRFRGKSNRRAVEISLEAQLTKFSSPSAPDEYSLSFDVKRGGIERTEDFAFKRTQGKGRRIGLQGSRLEVEDEKQAPRRQEVDSSVLGLALIQRLGRDAGRDQVAELTDALESFRVFEVDVAAARRPTERKPGERLASDASNLSSFLIDLAASDADVWEEFVSDARAVIPGLLDLEFLPIGGASESVVVTLTESGLSGHTTLQEASFGTIRALALLAVLYDPAPPRITCIEEIDHGLHPYALDRIVDLLRVASGRTQFIIATHSPVFVNRLRADELIVCERDPETGASRIPAVSSEAVRRMEAQDGLDLGELWFSGLLGGVPA
jgi:predicted ATPase